MNLIIAAVSVALYLWAFWYLYVLVMGFYRAHLDGRLTKTAWVLAMPAIIAGFTFDLVANWTIATIVFMEPPRRPLELVTDRLKRYIAGAPGFQQDRALWVCNTLLDYFDPSGKHCK